jgi:multidrug efflux pump subunit AcrA (membrane-fusion protein)
MANASQTSTSSRRIRRIALYAILAIVLLAAVGAGYYFWRRQTADSQSSASTFHTAVVTRGNVKLFASGTGDLISASEATFGFKTSGQVTAVLVKVGDIVDAGQILARLDDTTAQLTYQQAVQSLGALTSPSAIATAQLAVANDKVNVVTTRATLAYLISPEVLYWEEQVTARQEALQQAKDAAAANPSADADKKVKGAERDLKIAQSELAQAQLDYENDYVPATFLTTVKQGRTVTKEVIPPTPEDIAAAWANYELAKQTLAEDQDYLTALTTGVVPAGAIGSKIAALQDAQQNVVSAKNALDNTVLHAPIHGTVLSVGFGSGDTVGASSTISIADLDQPYTLEIFLDQSDWSNVQLNYSAEVTFDLLPNNVYTGKVTSIDPVLSNTNGNNYVHAYVQLDSPLDQALPLGTTASVDVVAAQVQNVLIVPLEALHKVSNGQYFVFVVANAQLRVRQVQVGLEDATHAEIKSGLSEGEVVSTGIMVTQ